MSSSNFPTDPHIPLVGDASVLINLIATGAAEKILRALLNPFLITENAFLEFAEGTEEGREDHDQLLRLIADGLVKKVTVGPTALPTYESLIGGSALRTLDDGEAATLAYAHEVAGAVLIDERKARSICTSSYPHLALISTVELLMHARVLQAIGVQGQSDAIFNALKIGRMRVPTEQIPQIVRIIGEERAAQCTSLPKAWRGSSR